MLTDTTGSLRQDYFKVMREGSKACGSSKQDRLDDRLTAVLLYSLGSSYEIDATWGQEVFFELRFILLERRCG